MKRTIVIVTRNKYPNEDAGAIRQHSIGKIFIDLGYRVFIIGNGAYTGFNKKVYDGIEYVSLRSNTVNKLKRLRDHLMFGKNAMKIINELSNSIFAIVVVDILPGAFSTIKKFAIKKNIHLIHDSVEWYSANEFKSRIFSIDFILKEYTNRIIIRKEWSVIAISTYLEEYFIRKGCNVIRLPVIMDIKCNKSQHSNVSLKRKIVYAGGPGRKDYLLEILKGINLLDNNDKKKIEFHIVGVNREQLIKICGVSQELLEKLNKIVYLHGRVSHEEAIKWIKEADFSILIRNEKLRYAKAGFPTKVVESLCWGTPVICNLSSDLNKYLNSYNSIIVEGHKPSDVVKALKKMIKLNDDNLLLMRKTARNTAEQNFDYRKYIKKLKNFIDHIDNNKEIK